MRHRKSSLLDSTIVFFMDQFGNVLFVLFHNPETRDFEFQMI